MGNPLAVLARVAVALDDFGREHLGKGPAGFEGIQLNVAALDGGIAFNVVPTKATLAFSLRPAPGAGVDELLAEAERRVRAATAGRRHWLGGGDGEPPLRHARPGHLRPAAGGAGLGAGGPRFLDRGGAAVRAGD